MRMKFYQRVLCFTTFANAMYWSPPIYSNFTPKLIYGAHYTTSDGKNLVIVGGNNGSNFRTDIWSLDLTILPTINWTKIGDTQTFWINATLTARGTSDTSSAFGYIFGLRNGNDLFNVSSNGFANEAMIIGPMSQRQLSGFVLANRTLFVYRGISITNALPDELWGFNLDTWSWTKWTVNGSGDNGAAQGLSLDYYNGSLYQSFGMAGFANADHKMYPLSLNFVTKTATRMGVKFIGSYRWKHKILIVNGTMVSLGGIQALNGGVTGFETWTIDLTNSSANWVQLNTTNGTIPSNACMDQPTAAFSQKLNIVVMLCADGSLNLLNLNDNIATNASSNGVWSSVASQDQIQRTPSLSFTISLNPKETETTSNPKESDSNLAMIYGLIGGVLSTVIVSFSIFWYIRKQRRQRLRERLLSLMKDSKIRNQADLRSYIDTLVKTMKEENNYTAIADTQQISELLNVEFKI